MANSLTDILVRPEEFYGNILRETESLKVPALIVLLGGIIGAAYGYLMGQLSAKMMAGVLPGMDSIILLSAVFGALVGVFIFWLIAAGIFHIISTFFHGQGSFTRTLEVIGYGYLPQVFGGIITLIAAVIYLPKVTVPVISRAALESPELMQEAVKAFMHDPAMVELTQITTLISIVFMLWSAHIWIFGMKQARGITMRDAAICIGVPIVVYVLYMIFNLGAL